MLTTVSGLKKPESTDNADLLVFISQNMDTIETLLAGKSPTSHNHTLDSLSNVTITSNSNGEILKWNGSAWINNTLAEAGIAAESHTHSGLYFPDTRGVIDEPQALTARNLSLAFKSNTSVNSPLITSNASYSHILNVVGWNASEGSGGWPAQVSIGDGISVRQATSATVWGEWRKLWSTKNLSIGKTTPSSPSDGDIWIDTN